jgi:hypothetical protein
MAQSPRSPQLMINSTYHAGWVAPRLLDRASSRRLSISWHRWVFDSPSTTQALRPVPLRGLLCSLDRCACLCFCECCSCILRCTLQKVSPNIAQAHRHTYTCTLHQALHTPQQARQPANLSYNLHTAPSRSILLTDVSVCLCPLCRNRGTTECSGMAVWPKRIRLRCRPRSARQDTSLLP